MEIMFFYIYRINNRLKDKQGVFTMARENPELIEQLRQNKTVKKVSNRQLFYRNAAASLRTEKNNIKSKSCHCKEEDGC